MKELFTWKDFAGCGSPADECARIANKMIMSFIDKELVEDIAVNGVKYGGDGFGLSMAQKQMENVHKMMRKLYELIYRNECSHEPMRSDEYPNYIVETKHSGNPICMHCSVELVAKWEKINDPS